MKKGRLGLLLISFIGLFLLFIYTQAEAENWKQYLKNEDGIWHYDKDSIHYPYNTDKNIVRVWTKFGGKCLLLEELRCSQREIQEIERYDLENPTGLRSPIEQRIHIIPGSRQEKLYNEVCK